MAYKATILMAEDKDEFRKIYGDRLRFAGYKVLDASDGLKALEVIKTEKVDLVMTDINMPNMDGYRLTSELRSMEEYRNLPIIVMSVFDKGEHLTKALEAGANEYFVKGQYTPNDITTKIEALLAKTAHE